MKTYVSELEQIKRYIESGIKHATHEQDIATQEEKELEDIIYWLGQINAYYNLKHFIDVIESKQKNSEGTND